MPKESGAMTPHSQPPTKPTDWRTSPKVATAPLVYSPSPKKGSNSQGLEDLAGSHLSYDARSGKQQDDDMDSNMQDGLRSEFGDETVPIHTTSPAVSGLILRICYGGLLIN